MPLHWPGRASRVSARRDRPGARRVVLVTDGDERAALAATRSLGRAGYRVVVVASGPRSLAGASRHATVRRQAPSALNAADAFAAAVMQIVARDGVEVILPVSEAAHLALLGERERLLPAVIPAGSLECFRQLCDKKLVLQTAASVGLSVPGQVVVGSREEALGLDSRGMRFPMVLKPGRSVAASAGGMSKHSVRHARDEAEFRVVVAALPEAAYPLLIQQRIVGDGIGVFLLVWDGVERAVFAHRRLREKPPAGGVSVFRESTTLPPSLHARSRALLDAFRWQGVAMVEFKVDASTGEPYLMEINPRLWGSVQLAIDAGVDFPQLLVDAALGAPATAPPSWRPDVRLRWWWGDVDHLLARFRHSADALALPPGAAGRWQTLRDVASTFGPGVREEVARLDDPLPFLLETTRWIRGR